MTGCKQEDSTSVSVAAYTHQLLEVHINWNILLLLIIGLYNYTKCVKWTHLLSYSKDFDGILYLMWNLMSEFNFNLYWTLPLCIVFSNLQYLSSTRTKCNICLVTLRVSTPTVSLSGLLYNFTSVIRYIETESNILVYVVVTLQNSVSLTQSSCGVHFLHIITPLPHCATLLLYKIFLSIYNSPLSYPRLVLTSY